MAMLRLVARDSGWLTVLPEVVVQDELRTGALVTVGQSTRLQENFYAITTLHRHRIERLEQLLAGAPAPSDVARSGPAVSIPPVCGQQVAEYPVACEVSPDSPAE